MKIHHDVRCFIFMEQNVARKSLSVLRLFFLFFLLGFLQIPLIFSTGICGYTVNGGNGNSQPTM